MTFNYAIQRPDGQFYNGRANVSWDELFTQSKQDTYTYTEAGARRRIEHVPAFAACKVVRVNW